MTHMDKNDPKVQNKMEELAETLRAHSEECLKEVDEACSPLIQESTPSVVEPSELPGPTTSDLDETKEEVQEKTKKKSFFQRLCKIFCCCCTGQDEDSEDEREEDDHDA